MVKGTSGRFALHTDPPVPLPQKCIRLVRHAKPPSCSPSIPFGRLLLELLLSCQFAAHQPSLRAAIDEALQQRLHKSGQCTHALAYRHLCNPWPAGLAPRMEAITHACTHAYVHIFVVQLDSVRSNGRSHALKRSMIPRVHRDCRRGTQLVCCLRKGWRFGHAFQVCEAVIWHSCTARTGRQH